MKVITFVGTRPEIIRLSAVTKALDKCTEHVVVHTGQNYDFELNELMFRDLGLRPPDIVMSTDTSSLGATIGSIISQAEPIIQRTKPDAALVLGDTNSCMAGLMAKRLHVPLFHMEAGNRCFDQNVPEETNRRIIDHIADFNLVYTEHARRNLLSEGIAARRIYLTGSPLREVLTEHRISIEGCTVLSDLSLKEREFILVSVHREENVEPPQRLRQVYAALQALASEFQVPIVLSAHPRTRKRLDALGIKRDERILEYRPFGFHAYNKLQLEALCTISDSGSISEESAIFGFPAISIRDSSERPEALDTGTILLSGIGSEAVVRCARQVIELAAANRKRSIPQEYTIEDTSNRVVNLILGLSAVSNGWSGIYPRV
jgi:UDP-N-acetylglucosamine 2-epimerase